MRSERGLVSSREAAAGAAICCALAVQWLGGSIMVCVAVKTLHHSPTKSSDYCTADETPPLL